MNLALLAVILAEIADGIIVTAEEAVAALLEAGVAYTGALTLTAIESYIQGLLSGGGGPTIVAIAPLAAPPTCTTPKAQHKGICCQALTQLGLAQAAAGFQYTSCSGKVVCLACGTKASVSKKHPGQTVFSVKRVMCGPSGCPALGAVQGQIVQPA